MEPNARENSDSKTEFRKPSNDAANRKYRRRSPVTGASSSSDGSQPCERSSSPVPSKKDIEKVADDVRKRDEGRDRLSSRSYHRHDNHVTRDRRSDDYDRGYSKPSYRSSRDSRDNSISNYSRSDREHPSRDYVKGVDAYTHGKSDGLGHRSKDKDSYDRTGSARRYADTEERDKDRDRDRCRDDRGDRYGRMDYRKSSMNHKGDHSPAYEDSRAQRNDYSSRRDSSGHRLKESSSRESKEVDVNDEKRRHEDVGPHKVQVNGATEENPFGMLDKTEEALTKKLKTSNTDCTAAGPEGPAEKAYVTDSDIDAAKIAAMKAAELVNKNLIGTGYMTADQKKKLLWGNKKNTAMEEPAHRWDTKMFGDHDRQEKFKKLMGVKGDTKIETKLDNPDVEKQQEQLQMELERQYTAGLRRRDGRTVGLGL